MLHWLTILSENRSKRILIGQHQLWAVFDRPTALQREDAMRHLLRRLAGVMASLVILSGVPAMAGGPPGSMKDAPYMHSANPNWSGLYIGAAVGYSFSQSDLTHNWTDVGPIAVRDTYGIDENGLIGTASVGFDRQNGSGFVWGLFADYTFGSIKDSVTLSTPGNVDLRFKLQDSWAVGGRLGMIHSGALWYVAAGYTGIDASFADFEKTLHGYFIGAGLEREIHPNLRLKLEYRFSDYGRETLYSNAGCCAERLDLETNTHSFRLGISYVFRRDEMARHEPLK